MQLLANALPQLAGKLIGSDPAVNSTDPAPNVCTPRVVKALIQRLIRDYGEQGEFQNLATILAGLTVQISNTTPTRMTASIPAQVIDVMDQTATQILQVA